MANNIKIQKKRKLLMIHLVLLMLVCIMSLDFVLGFAVSSSYYAGIQISPGEERDIYLTLQNMAGSENLTAIASIGEGSEIARFTDPSTTYFIPLGTHQKVNIHLSIPENTAIGTKYNLTLSFSTVKSSQPGEFGLSSGVGERIGVEVVEWPKPPEPKPESVEQPMPEGKNDIGIIILTVAVILIIGLLITQTMVKRRKSKKSLKKKILKK